MSESQDTEPLPRQRVAGEESRAPIGHYELVILCLDVSASMSNPQHVESGGAEPRSTANVSRADVVIQHLLTDHDSLLDKLRKSLNRHSFFLSLVTFDDIVKVIDPVRVDDRATNTQLHLTAQDLKKMMRFGDSTAIGDGLRAAGVVAETWLQNGLPAREGTRRHQTPTPQAVTIILLSDGHEMKDSDPAGAAKAIHDNAIPVSRLGNRPSIVIATAAYGSDADEILLRSLASNDASGRPMYRRVVNGASLRRFCIQSLTL